jgi:predicted phosphodiesterase
MSRYAVLSDIHGNRWALEAILADIRRRGEAELLNLGDLLYGPLDPEGTAKRLMELDMPSTTVRGNEDDVLFDSDADPIVHSSLHQTRNNLSEDSLAWLNRFRPRERVGPILLVHGTPEDDATYLLEEVNESGVHRRRPDEVARLAPGDDTELVLCGHSHLSGCLRIPGGPLVVNPGSVGLPAYSDDRPFAHRMEAGSPHARYAIVDKCDAGWVVELIALPYDWEAAAATAEMNGRLDWAWALRTGFVKGEPP